MVIYEIVPDEIIITAPFLMNMVPQMANGLRFTTQQAEGSRYAYDLCLDDAFLDQLVSYKAAFIADDAGRQQVEAYYQNPMFELNLRRNPPPRRWGRLHALDGYAQKMGMPTSLEAALMDNNACGLKMQTTYVPN